MEKFTSVLVILLLLFFPLVFAGSSDNWKSCCSSSCDYSPSKSISIGGITYYCCSNGWQTSPCSGQVCTPNSWDPDNCGTCNYKSCNYQTGKCEVSTVSCGRFCKEDGSGWGPCECHCQDSCSSEADCQTTTTTTTTTPGGPSPPGPGPSPTTSTTTTTPGGGTSTTTTTTTTLPPAFPHCNSISPTVAATPVVASADYLTASVMFSCQEWNYTIKNLTLTLYIDNQEWTQCFLDKKGLVTDFGWDGSQMDEGSPNCKKN